MPFTPFHMGPALALKAVSGRYFSLTVFGFSQVAIDLEPLVRIARGDVHVHGFTHSYLGATLIALVSIVVGRPLCQWLLRYWKPDPGARYLDWMRAPAHIPWPAAIAGAFVGAYSHVAVDSIMHADMQPFAPLSQGNALLHVISVESLHVACVLSGALGALLMIALSFVRHRGGADRGN